MPGPVPDGTSNPIWYDQKVPDEDEWSGMTTVPPRTPLTPHPEQPGREQVISAKEAFITPPSGTEGVVICPSLNKPGTVTPTAPDGAVGDPEQALASIASATTNDDAAWRVMVAFLPLLELSCSRRGN